jgi:hypothetical protein
MKLFGVFDEPVANRGTYHGIHYVKCFKRGTNTMAANHFIFLVGLWTSSRGGNSPVVWSRFQGNTTFLTDWLTGREWGRGGGRGV